MLEYDEVMEHQRQTFYGLRQRVLEGRDVRGLVFDFIRDTVDDAVGKYLDDNYPAECAAEYAKAKLDCSIDPMRLKGKELNEMEKAIRDEAAYESRQSIDITLGEYMPMAGSEVNVDFDPSGLVKWAKNRFGVDLDPAKLQHGSDDERKLVRDILVRRAEVVVESTDLSGLSAFVQKDYGAGELAKWAGNMLLQEVKVSDILAARKVETQDGSNPVTNMLMERVEAWYRKREVEYPVEFGVDDVPESLRMQSPMEAAKRFLAVVQRPLRPELDARALPHVHAADRAGGTAQGQRTHACREPHGRGDPAGVGDQDRRRARCVLPEDVRLPTAGHHALPARAGTR